MNKTMTVSRQLSVHCVFYRKSLLDFNDKLLKSILNSILNKIYLHQLKSMYNLSTNVSYHSITEL